MATINEQYYTLQHMQSPDTSYNGKFIVQLAHRGRLMSKYSNLIKYNGDKFASWYDQLSQHVKRKHIITYVLIAIKSDFEDTIDKFMHFVINLCNKRCTKEYQRNFTLFFSSNYHKHLISRTITIDILYNGFINEHIYSYSWRNFHYIIAEIIDTEIIDYTGRTTVSNIYEARQEQLSRQFWSSTNYWHSLSQFFYKSVQIIGYNEHKIVVGSYASMNFLCNLPWHKHRAIPAKSYEIIKQNSNNLAEIVQSAQQGSIMVSEDRIRPSWEVPLPHDFSPVMRWQIAKYGLYIDMSRVCLLQQLGILFSYASFIQALLYIGFNLEYSLISKLDHLQIMTLIYTGVLEMYNNSSIIYRVNNPPISDILKIFPHITASNRFVNLLYLPIYSAVANNFISFLQHDISALQLISIYKIPAISLIRKSAGTTIISNWSHTKLDGEEDELSFILQLISNLCLIWPYIAIKNELHYNKAYMAQLINYKYQFTMDYDDRPMILELDSDKYLQGKYYKYWSKNNSELCNMFSLANIYSRVQLAYIVKKIDRSKLFLRLANYTCGDGKIYHAATKKTLSYNKPEDMMQLIIDNHISYIKMDIAILSLIYAYDLINSVNIWNRLRTRYNLSYLLCP